MDWGVACFFLFSAGLVLGGLLLEYRKNHLSHLERMAAIEKGIPPASLDERPLQVYFRRGLLWLIPGIGLTMFLWFVPDVFSRAWNAVAVLMICIGLAYVPYCFFVGRRRSVS